MRLQTGRVLRGGRHALIELLAVQREAGDLVARLQNGWPLAAPDRATFYDGGAEVYADYLRLVCPVKATGVFSMPLSPRGLAGSKPD